MIVYNELLGYPKYKIVQDTEMFNFSTDSILLASFATVNAKMKRVVDFCSGNFPIPIYLTLRTDASIDGIEIQEAACNLAKESLRINNLGNQITIHNEDVIGIHKKFGLDYADLILCNPPFFIYQEDSNINHNLELTIARHEIKIKLEDVIKEASLILRQGGYFAMVHRPERLVQILSLMEKYKLMPSRLQFVYPKMGKEANHLLIEGRKGGKKNPNLRILAPLYVHDENNQWTNDILKIYNYKKEE